jgi:hypothetical protein
MNLRLTGPCSSVGYTAAHELQGHRFLLKGQVVLVWSKDVQNVHSRFPSTKTLQQLVLRVRYPDNSAVSYRMVATTLTSMEK